MSRGTGLNFGGCDCLSRFEEGIVITHLVKVGTAFQRPPSVCMTQRGERRYTNVFCYEKNSHGCLQVGFCTRPGAAYSTLGELHVRGGQAVNDWRCLIRSPRSGVLEGLPKKRGKMPLYKYCKSVKGVHDAFCHAASVKGLS